MAKEGTLDSILKAYLFATDRYIRMKNITQEDLKNKIMLFDRYVPSALAYRMSEGVDKNWVTNINSVFPKADIGFFIDITPNESVNRNTDTKFNIKATPERLGKVRNAYLSILDENNLIYINGKLAIVLPHPSPLNIKWFKDHPEFMEKRIFEIIKIINKVLEEE